MARALQRPAASLADIPRQLPQPPRVQALAAGAGLPVALDARRGHDHGCLVPLAVMYPDGQVPVPQISLRAGLNPAEHLAFGRALARLGDWQHAPTARQCHPREEHLLPLMVAVGAPGTDPAACVYRESDIFGGITASSFRFGTA